MIQTATRTQTFAEICGQLGRRVESVGKTYGRHFKDKKFNRHAVPTDREYAVCFGTDGLSFATSVRQSPSAPIADNWLDTVEVVHMQNGQSFYTIPKEEAEPIHSPTPAEPNSGNWAASSGQKWKLTGLYFLLIAATIASVYNILRVSMEIADLLSAIVLTVVLSIAAVVFVASGIKTRFTRILVGFLIAFEAVCNLVRIYGGLTQWEKATPTEFLGTICQVCNTGAYETARIVATLTALLIAGVQYASIFEINKIK